VPDNNLILKRARHLSNKNLRASGPAGLGPADPPKTRNFYGDFMGVTVDAAKAIELGEGDRRGGPTDRRPPWSSI
jgi:hypothetical protein